MPRKWRLDKIEQEILELKEKQKAQEQKITSMEEELEESYRRVKELEVAAGNTPTLPTSSDDGPNSSVRQKITDIERKCTAIGKKCDQLTKLQTILNGLILKGCRMTQPDTQLKQVQEQLQGAQSNLQDGLPATFESSQKKVMKHKVPLNLMDYTKLSALESIAGQPDGPANQIGLYVFINFPSKRDEVVTKLKADGLTATQAMIDYISLSSATHPLPKDTRFFFVVNWYNDSWKQVLFGTNRESLYLLDIDTKKVIKEWKMRDVTACTIDTSDPWNRHIRVDFGQFCVLRLKSNEMMEYLGLIRKCC